MVTGLAVASLVLGTGSAIFGVTEGRRARKEAEGVQKEAKKEQRAVEAERTRKERALRFQTSLRLARLRGAAPGPGRGGTVLAGGGGVSTIGQQPLTQKSLIGN